MDHSLKEEEIIPRCSTPLPVTTDLELSDLYYAAFIRNMKKPLKGRIRGLKTPPPDVISGHFVMFPDKSTAKKNDSMAKTKVVIKNIMRRFNNLSLGTKQIIHSSCDSFQTSY